MEKAFDRTQLKSIENATKGMANAHYQQCLYMCDEKNTDFNGSCKQMCFQNILVPYHMIKH